MAQRGSKIRHIRVPDELWEAGRAAADANGTTASTVMVEALRKYVTRHAPKAE